MRTVWLLSFCFVIQTLALSTESVMAQARKFSMERSNPDNLPDLDWENVDYGTLTEKVRGRGVAETDADLERLFSFNMRFVYSNKYRRDRFLVDPGPQQFVETIILILELNERLDGLIVEGRKLVAAQQSPESRKRGKRLVRDISEIAKELKEVFTENFLELHGSTVEVAFVRRKGVEALKFYLIQAGRINRMLTDRLNEYFFGTAPGAVSVPDYKKATVNVLAQALIKLGELNLGRI